MKQTGRLSPLYSKYIPTDISSAGKHAMQAQTIIHIFIFTKQQHVSSVTYHINCQQEDLLNMLF